MTLPREAWPRLKEVFEGARRLAVDARQAYLAAACKGDEALRREVEALLASHERANSFLETPAVFDDTTVTKSAEGQRIGPYQLGSLIGAGEWAKSTAPATPSSGAMSRSKSSRATSRAIPTASCASSVKRASWQASIIRISARSTALKRVTLQQAQGWR